MDKLKKIGKVLVNFNAAAAFYITLILLLILTLAKVEKSIMVGSIIACLFFLIRLVYRAVFIKRGQGIVLHNLNFTLNQEIQGDMFADVAALMLYLLLCILEMPWANMDAGEWTGIFLLYSSIYFVMATFSVKKNSVILKAITLTLSTLQGLLGVMFLVAYACMCITSVLDGRGIENMQFIEGNLFDEMIIVGTYTLEFFPAFTLISMIVSVLLYVIYILNTPIYQLEKLKIAYNVVNVFVTLVGIFAFFFSKYYERFIVENMNSIMNSEEYVDFMTAIPNAMEYLKSFGESNINNLFYLLILPYAFGILISNMCIEKKERKAEGKRKEILKKFYSQEMCTEDKIMELRKEYLYWGGDLIECDAYIQLGKMNNQQEEKEEVTEF